MVFHILERLERRRNCDGVWTHLWRASGSGVGETTGSSEWDCGAGAGEQGNKRRSGRATNPDRSGDGGREDGTTWIPLL